MVIGLAVRLLLQPVSAEGSAAGDRVRETVDELLRILKDPQLKGEHKSSERREKLKAVISRRFDFTEMAKRSLGSEWRRRSPEEQRKFVELFTELLEQAYLDKIESYNGEKVQYLRDQQDNNHAEVGTKIVDNKGREFSVTYRLHSVNGDWKVYDVVIEDISLVSNYRAQFNRVLAKGTFEELLTRMKGKKFSAPATET